MENSYFLLYTHIHRPRCFWYEINNLVIYSAIYKEIYFLGKLELIDSFGAIIFHFCDVLCFPSNDLS